MKNLMNLTGERILVSGAAGAIGGAAARVCACLGADVILTDQREPRELADALGGGARAYALDNTRRREVESLIAGLGSIDALIDCSGLYSQGDWLADAEWDALLDRIMAVNVKGPMNLIRACLPGMIERGHGRIVLTGSIGARNGGTTLAAEPAYLASKGALHTLVRYFARQAAGHGVVVNGVAPGAVLTPMLMAANQPFQTASFPMKRMADPDEIGWPIAFLGSRGSSFTTGAILDVNGGVAFS